MHRNIINVDSIYIYYGGVGRGVGRGGGGYRTPHSKIWGGGLSMFPPSMKYDNIHERIFERYLLSSDIKNDIIQLYKSELLNI